MANQRPDTTPTVPSGPGQPLGPTEARPGVVQSLKTVARQLPRWFRVGASRFRSTLSQSRGTLTLLGISVAGAVGIFFLMGFAGLFNLSFVIKYFSTGFGPCLLALEFTTFSYVLGMAGAIGLGLVRAFPPRRGRGMSIGRWPLYGFASGYVATIRGTPFLVQMFIVYYSVIAFVPKLTFLGWDVEYLAGFIALLINTTGYQAEAFRGGFQSVDAGQIEAAKAVGLSRLQVFARITLPQSLRLVTLPLANEWISNFKTATILSYISIVEIFYWARTKVGFDLGHPLEGLIMLTVFYLLINVTISRAITYLEKVRRIPGLGTPIPEVGVSSRLFGKGILAAESRR